MLTRTLRLFVLMDQPAGNFGSNWRPSRVCHGSGRALHQRGIQAGRAHMGRAHMGRVNGNHSAVIAWPELVGIDFLEPTPFRSGHITSPPPPVRRADWRRSRLAGT
jgi:hypothetical protein